MEAISAIGIFSSIVYILLLFNKRNRSFSDNILIVWMFLFIIHLTLPFMISIRNRFFIEKIDGLDIGLYTLHLTFLYYYALSLVDNSLKFKPVHLFLLVPTAFIYIFQNVIYANIELLEPIVSKYFYSSNELFLLSCVVFMNLIFCIYFCNKIIQILATHRKTISNNFSFSENIDLNWLKNLSIAALILTTVMFAILIALLNGKLNETWVNNIYFSSVSIFAIILGYLGYKQGVILVYSETESDKKIQDDKRAKTTFQKDIFRSSENQSPFDKKAQKLLDYMEKEKPFLDPKLSIGTVANNLGIHMHQLSRIINNDLKQNFYDFINNYRIEEFKKLAADPKNKHFSILGLALDAGFNSKATFNRIFKNSTGQTPSQFRNNFNY